VISGFVKGSFKVDEYKQLATLTVNSASEDVLKAEPVVARARNRVNSVSDKALEKVRQVKYKEADDYLNAQKAIYDAKQAAKQAAIDRDKAEQAALDKVRQAIYDAEQAAIDKAEAEQAAIEMENEWLQLVLQSLYEA
jgi:predicted thioredoxin/glutaredoxin